MWKKIAGAGYMINRLPHNILINLHVTRIHKNLSFLIFQNPRFGLPAVGCLSKLHLIFYYCTAIVALGEMLLKLGRLKEASEIYKELIDRNSENWHYYEGLEKALQARKWYKL